MMLCRYIHAFTWFQSPSSDPFQGILGNGDSFLCFLIHVDIPLCNSLDTAPFLTRDVDVAKLTRTVQSDKCMQGLPMVVVVQPDGDYFSIFCPIGQNIAQQGGIQVWIHGCPICG